MERARRVLDFIEELRTIQELRIESLTAVVDGMRIQIDRAEALRDPAPIAPPADRCTAAILSTLSLAGRRLTTTQLLAAMDLAGYQFSERTISGRLAQAVRDGLLTTDRSGYGIPT